MEKLAWALLGFGIVGVLFLGKQAEKAVLLGLSKKYKPNKMPKPLYKNDRADILAERMFQEGYYGKAVVSKRKSVVRDEAISRMVKGVEMEVEDYDLDHLLAGYHLQLRQVEVAGNTYRCLISPSHVIIL